MVTATSIDDLTVKQMVSRPISELELIPSASLTPSLSSLHWPRASSVLL